MTPRLFVNQLSVLDCAFLHPQRGLVGASWIVDVVLEGELNAQGMLFDFGPAKRQIKEIIDTHADHKLVVALADPRLQWQEYSGEVTLAYTSDSGTSLKLRSPQQAFCELPGDAADCPALSRMLENKVFGALPDNISAISITLRDEKIDGAAYAYCHGLKQHRGNCQRIAHGHRSRIEIFADGTRSAHHEQYLADSWQDIYLGNRADLVGDVADSRYRFAYAADQGRFELELDAAHCELLDAQSTVENIAVHVAKKLKQREPDIAFTVNAYEGVGKGAVASA